jgi:hypothetical protein
MPTLNMDAVTAMLERGLSWTRNSMVRLTRDLVHDANCDDLQLANVTLPVHWDLAVSGILSAVNITAHDRYVTWFRGKKHPHDSSYSPSEPEVSQEPARTRSHTRSGARSATRKLANISQPSSRKHKGKTAGVRGSVNKRAKASTASMGDR